MKSLITRFASIGSIFALVLAASSAAAVPLPISVNVHEVATISYNGTVLVEVAAACSGGGTLPVSVELTQSTTQSHAGTAAAGTGVSSVSCNSMRQSVALTVPATTGPFNLGDATADSVSLGLPDPSELKEIMKPIQIVFAVGENHEEEEGGNPEE
jgi:hypothetical protein